MFRQMGTYVCLNSPVVFWQKSSFALWWNSKREVKQEREKV